MPLFDRIRSRREERDTPERTDAREVKKARRRKIVERIAALIGIVGGHFTGANWIGKSITVLILGAAAYVVKAMFAQ